MALRIQVVTASSHPIYKQIVDQVRAAIARGTAEPGDPLPSVRALAEELMVNMNTVAKAYGELVRHGDVISEPGRGVFVAPRRPGIASVERKKKLNVAIERLVAEAVHLGVSREELIEAIEDYCERSKLLAARRAEKHNA